MNDNDNNNDINADIGGCTQLHVAAEQGNHELVDILLAHPYIDVNATEIVFGETPLHWAASRGHVKVVESLLAHPRIDVNIEDQYGCTAFQEALENRHTDVIRIFLLCPTATTLNINEKMF